MRYGFLASIALHTRVYANKTAKCQQHRYILCCTDGSKEVDLVMSLVALCSLCSSKHQVSKFSISAFSFLSWRVMASSWFAVDSNHCGEQGSSWNRLQLPDVSNHRQSIPGAGMASSGWPWIVIAHCLCRFIMLDPPLLVYARLPPPSVCPYSSVLLVYCSLLESTLVDCTALKSTPVY